MEDYELNAVLDKIKIYDEYKHTLLELRDNEVHKLKEYLDTQEEKIKQLTGLIHYLNNEIINMTEELNSIEL